MNEIFVDTSAWDAIEDANDANHEIALLFKEEIAEKYRLVTTCYVLDETYTLLLLNIGYVRTVKFKRNIDVMAELGILTVVHISESIERAAWEIFERFNIDKKWSFTDCTSKIVMEQRNIYEVFAFDHHFEQMGFVRKP
ncbi:type II toxin-antitoxin system VapC family toxin [Candidatus Poribacteria bacterium]|nr:type II toxin-antitoxin system VapC family toxin [Candidatus Poribacteria bacterium]